MITSNEISNDAWEEWAEYYQEGKKTSKEILKEIEDKIIDFAKMHVTEALRQASEKARTPFDSDGDAILDKNSILTAYSLDNVV